MKRALPYLTPTDRVKAGEWILLTGRGEPLGSAALAWDYNARIQLSRIVEVDYGGALKDCVLAEGTELMLCVRSWTSASRIRSLLLRKPLDKGSSGQNALTVSIDGAGLGGTLNIQTSLELARHTPGEHPFSPNRSGTVLWRDTIAVPLEGDGGLLPLAPVSFSENARLPDGAAWYVSLDFTDWHAAAMGCLLVLVNTDTDLISQALATQDDDPLASAMWSALGVDIVADVISKALDDESYPLADLAASQDEETLTLVGLVTALIRSYLRRPAESDVEAFNRLRDLRRGDPSMYRAEVQRGLRFLREVNA